MARSPIDIEDGKPAVGEPEPDAQENQPARKKGENEVDLRATGSFHEMPDFGGRLLQHGDTFIADRGRAAELRAAGLVEYIDEKLETAAKEHDPAPADNMGQAAITTRSIGRRIPR